MMKERPFAALDAEFNVEPTKLPDSIQESEELVPAEIDEFSSVLSKDGGMDNKEFVVEEMKSLIFRASKVLQKLEDDVKIGCPPRMYEVYAKAVDSVSSAIGKLADIEVNDSRLKASARKINAKAESNNFQQNNYIMNGTSTDMLKMLKELKKNSKAFNPYEKELAVPEGETI